jgi:hypothetical protein
MKKVTATRLFAALACAWVHVGTVTPVAYGGEVPRFTASDINSPDFFPILPWDPYHGWAFPGQEKPAAAMQSIADCHFNMAGFVLPKDLKLCEKLGLGAIVLPSDKTFTNFNYLRDWKKLSDQQIEQRVETMIKAAGSSRAIMGYFITDEPGIEEFPALEKAVAAVKKFAPGKLAYINLYPDYATLGAPDHSQLGTSNYTDYLERFVAEVKPRAVSYDNYMVQSSDDLKNAERAASYFRNMLEIRRVSQRNHLPFLNIVCCNQIRPRTPVPSPANLMLQAYTTLAAGYRGVTWYNYFGPGYHYTPIEHSGERSMTWTWLRDVNAQIATLAPVMSKLTSTGVFFTTPPPARGLPVLPGRLVANVECSMPIMVGEFTHRDGASYAMLVNLSLERSARYELKPVEANSKIKVISAANGRESEFKQEEHSWLVAGQGLLIKFESQK